VSTHPTLLAMDYFGPAISAVLFVLIMSFMPEPTRLRFNAIFAAGAVEFIVALAGRSWPGNVRELQNFIERSLVLSTGGVLNGSLPELTDTIQAPLGRTVNQTVRLDWRD
jgi:transcriptional regulator with PAS, ATPase and Fis domain